ncbi:MAG: hypothetical protein LBC12_01165 [Nitrososphaerota archaeon]|nr:hypothetical protein [Nitrososphaerota archaeon]
MLGRLQQLKVKVFFADHWEAYAELIPSELLVWTMQRYMGWSVIVFVSGIGVVGFVGKLVWFHIVCV